ncbi:MAG TPA: hypothetical protein VGM87_15135 [Roseomonas sp.]|jgi:hypothetical protein
MSATGALRNGLARLYLFPNGVQHVAWAWMQNGTEIYSSWAPKKGGTREYLGRAPVPSPHEGGTATEQPISLMEANRNPSLQDDDNRFGTPRSIDVAGLHLTWMERYHRYAYKLGSADGVEMPAYLLRSVRNERTNGMETRFNCVIHCMRLFRAGLIGVRLPEQFGQNHSAALGLHWRKPEEITAASPGAFTIQGPFLAHSAYGEVIHAKHVFELVQRFQAERG